MKNRKIKPMAIGFMGLFIIFSCEKEQPKDNLNTEKNIVYTNKKGIKGENVEHYVYRIKQDSHDSTDYKMSIFETPNKGNLKSVNGDRFFSDITIAKSEINVCPYDRYDSNILKYLMDRVDLNKGAGGYYIYAYVTKTSDIEKAITDIKFSSSSSRPSGYHSFSSILYSSTANNWYPTSNVDLNDGAGGDYIYGYYKTNSTSFLNEPINGLGIIYGSSASIKPPWPWEKINKDLNAGAGGDFIYMIYRKGGYFHMSHGVWRPWQMLDILNQIVDYGGYIDIQINDFGQNPIFDYIIYGGRKVPTSTVVINGLTHVQGFFDFKGIYSNDNGSYAPINNQLIYHFDNSFQYIIAGETYSTIFPDGIPANPMIYYDAPIYFGPYDLPPTLH